MIDTIAISERQLEIIEAAGRILTKSGVSGLTIKNLAAEMEFSESAIYRHFGSKEEIIVGMLNYLASTMEKLLSRATDNDLRPEEKFKALIRSHYGFFQKNPHFVVAVFSDGLMEQSEKVNEAILSIMGTVMKHLMPVLLEGQQKQVFTNAIGIEELMHLVMGTYRLQMFKWRIANFEPDIGRNVENMIASLLTLIMEKNK